VVLVLLYQKYHEAKRRALIKPNDIIFRELTFENERDGPYKLVGTVKNTSKHYLQSIGVTLVIQDCMVPFDPDKYLARSRTQLSPSPS
jgi:hypothetical protein